MTSEATRSGVREADGTTTEYDEVPVDRRYRRAAHDRDVSRSLGGRLRRTRHRGRRVRDPVPAAPKVSMLDGYLTVDTGAWHFHLCVNDHRGAATPEQAQVRRVARAAFFRTEGGTCVPGAWGLRLWNGRGEQMVTVFFPNPWLDDDAERFARRAGSAPRSGRTCVAATPAHDEASRRAGRCPAGRRVGGGRARADRAGPGRRRHGRQHRGAWRDPARDGLQYFHESIGGSPAKKQFTVQLAVRGLTEQLELGVNGEPLVSLSGAERRHQHRGAGAERQVRLPRQPIGLGVADAGAAAVREAAGGQRADRLGQDGFRSHDLASFALPADFGLDLNAASRGWPSRRTRVSGPGAGRARPEPRRQPDGEPLLRSLLRLSRRAPRPRQPLLDAGVLWRPTPNVALDASVVTSLVGPGPDWGLRAGVSVRFGR